MARNVAKRNRLRRRLTWAPFVQQGVWRGEKSSPRGTKAPGGSSPSGRAGGTRRRKSRRRMGACRLPPPVPPGGAYGYSDGCGVVIVKSETNGDGPRKFPRTKPIWSRRTKLNRASRARVSRPGCPLAHASGSHRQNVNCLPKVIWGHHGPA